MPGSLSGPAPDGLLDSDCTLRLCRHCLRPFAKVAARVTAPRVYAAAGICSTDFGYLIGSTTDRLSFPKPPSAPLHIYP